MLRGIVLLLAASAVAAVHVQSMTPSGTYRGEKKLLGEKVKASIVLVNSTHLDLAISGAVNINCESEPYVFSGGEITLADHSSSDCVQHKLDKKNAEFRSAKYDARTNELTVDCQIHQKKISGGTRKVDVSLALQGTD